MGDNVTSETISKSAGKLDNATLPPWLDAQSSALVQDIIATLAQRYPDLLAIVLFGSVARHDERPLSDPLPSDVDLLAIFDTNEDPVHLPRGLDITHTIGLARNRHLDAPREVQVMFATRAMREWDSTSLPMWRAMGCCSGRAATCLSH
jgi:predicted nucleotidyltransferase